MDHNIVQIVERPWWSLAKLMFVIIVFLMIGTLPFIDNWSHVGGFVFGFSNCRFITFRVIYFLQVLCLASSSCRTSTLVQKT